MLCKKNSFLRSFDIKLIKEEYPTCPTLPKSDNNIMYPITAGNFSTKTMNSNTSLVAIMAFLIEKNDRKK